jgi:hypothetical protein
VRPSQLPESSSCPGVPLKQAQASKKSRNRSPFGVESELRRQLPLPSTRERASPARPWSLSRAGSAPFPRVPLLHPSWLRSFPRSGQSYLGVTAPTPAGTTTRPRQRYCASLDPHEISAEPRPSNPHERQARYAHATATESTGPHKRRGRTPRPGVVTQPSLPSAHARWKSTRTSARDRESDDRTQSRQRRKARVFHQARELCTLPAPRRVRPGLTRPMSRPRNVVGSHSGERVLHPVTRPDHLRPPQVQMCPP